MQQQKTPSPFTFIAESAESARYPALAVQLTHLIEYFGPVCHTTNERVLAEIKEALIRDPERELALFITSAGGPSGVAMSFYDAVRSIMRPRLTTIGAGDVDSSGVVLLLAGTTRLVTLHTTMLLHPAGRIFDEPRRFTAEEMNAMHTEDRLKDRLYASVVAENSRGKLTTEDVLDLMARHTILSADEIVAAGIADDVLKNS